MVLQGTCARFATLCVIALKVLVAEKTMLILVTKQFSHAVHVLPSGFDKKIARFFLQLYQNSIKYALL